MVRVVRRKLIGQTAHVFLVNMLPETRYLITNSAILVSMTKVKQWGINWMKKQESKGLCIFCREPALPSSKRCEKHTIVQMARSHGIDDWELLRDLFYEQECKCYLTGRMLILGKNASLDRVIAKSENPYKASSINNILWCDRTVNTAKSGIPLEQFISMCHEVAAKFPNKKKRPL
jgi:hypothetical protein